MATESCGNLVMADCGLEHEDAFVQLKEQAVMPVVEDENVVSVFVIH